MRRDDIPICWVSSLLAWSMAVVGGACGDQRVSHPEPREAFEQLRHQTPDEVAATVDETPVGLREFQAYWNRHPELDREQVLEDVLEREVVVQRALQEGREAYVEHLGYVRKRSMVQQLLRRMVERRVTREDLEEEAIESKVEALRKQGRRPPGLKASHLLVMLPKSVRTSDGPSRRREQLESKARTWSERIRDSLSTSPSVEDLYRALQNVEAKVPEPLRVVVNAQLTFPRAGAARGVRALPDGWRRVVPDFAEGAEALADSDRLGQLSEPVRSKYGWHLVVVHETLPELVPEPEALRELAVDRVLRRRRTERLQMLFRRWKRGVSISTRPGVFERESTPESANDSSK